MERASPAEGEQGVVTRVPPLLGTDALDCVHHVGVRQPDCVVGERHRCGAQGSGKRFKCTKRGLAVDGHATAKEPLWTQGAADDVGIGNRRQGTATAIAGRAGRGAAGPRADVEHAAIVAPDDAAAAGADSSDVEHRRAHRQAINFRFGLDGWPTLRHEAHIRAGTAHVEGDDVPEPAPSRDLDGADHPSGGSREQGRNSVLLHGLGGQPAAIRLHDAQPPGEAAGVQPISQAAEIATNHRLHVGGEDRCGAALIFPELRADGVGADDAQCRGYGSQQIKNPPLVPGVREGIQQAHRHHVRLDSGDGRRKQRTGRMLVQRFDDRAVRPGTLGQFDDVLAGDDRCWLAIN